MNNLEKYLDEVIEHKPTTPGLPPVVEEESQVSLLQALRRRWYIVLAVFVVFGLGVPFIWWLVKPRYVMTGYIHVAPLVSNIFTGESNRGGIASYENYVNTKATEILSGPRLSDVADRLNKTDPSIFKPKVSSHWIGKVFEKLTPPSPDPDGVKWLRRAVLTGDIVAAPLRRTEYIAVTAKNGDRSKAEHIVNALLDSFNSAYGSEIGSDRDNTLELLRARRDDLMTKIEGLYDEMHRQTGGTEASNSDATQELQMQIQASLLTELARLGSRKMSLEARIAALDPNTALDISQPEQLTAARKSFVSSDPMIQELTENIVQMERDLIVAREQLTPGNPELVRRQNLLDAFRASLEEKTKDLEGEFDDQIAGQSRTVVQRQREAAQVELAQLLAYEKQLEANVKVSRQEFQQTGQALVKQRDLEFQMGIEQQHLRQVLDQLENLEIRDAQKPRIGIFQRASLMQIEDKRVKYTAALLFAGLACGCGLAFLREKTDKTLETPDDVARFMTLPLLGTTTCSRAIKPAQFAEQIAGDYQAIRTSLNLQANGTAWRRMAVCSPGMREGKTTFSVNLATSLAKSGKKVLLIDGDLRKPGVRHMLKMSNGTLGLQDVLLGEDVSQAVVSLSDSGLDVLPANSRHLADAYELLVSPTAREQMERLGREYDHVIIDTPPTLAFPDAQVWATMADAVVLVGFAGRTTAEELQEAQERLSRVRARVLGVILSNVAADESLYRYGYEYAYRNRAASSMASAGKQRRLVHEQPPLEDPRG